MTLALLSALIVAACTITPPPSGQTDHKETGAPEVTLPPTDGVFDYQLGGVYDGLDRGSGAIDVVVRDATAAPLSGAYSICYVNGFQTQPGEAEAWLAHEELLLKDDSGEPVTDPEWPEEYILDPATETRREGILDVLGPVVAGCAEAGFDAVEIDNLDTWTRFEGIDETGALVLAAAYVDLAHEAGLAIGQKNAAEITRTAREELGFDFAVTEECAVWDECASYSQAYGEHVLQIEYPDALDEAGVSFAEVCESRDRATLTILRDRGLVAAGEPAHLYEAC